MGDFFIFLSAVYLSPYLCCLNAFLESVCLLKQKLLACMKNVVIFVRVDFGYVLFMHSYESKSNECIPKLIYKNPRQLVRYISALYTIRSRSPT